MPNTQTLEELKAENAKAEQEAAEKSAIEAEESNVEAVEETETETVIAAEQEQEEVEEETIEAWMQNDTEEVEDGDKKFSDSDMAKMREKLKSKAEVKISEKDSELEALRAEMSQLKQSLGEKQQPATTLQKPTLESFDYDEAKYSQAMESWLLNQVDSRIQATTKASELTAKQQQAEAQKQAALNSHYERAAKLIKESNIEPELYQASDLAVRQTISSVAHFSKNADAVADELIIGLGEGSDKVMYYLGRNQQAKLKLREALEADPTGLRAGVLLGEMKTKITQPVKKTSNASKPAPKAGGESGGVSSFKRKYDKAKTSQERFNIKREARLAGVNTREWY